MGPRKEFEFEGDTIEGELEIGQISGLIHDIKPAAEIVYDFIKEYEIALNEQNSSKFNF